MPPPEMWFVYNHTEGDFSTYLSKEGAQAAYDNQIKQINSDVGEDGEYEGDETIYMGQIRKRAEVLAVGFDPDINEDRYSLISYAFGGAL